MAYIYDLINIAFAIFVESSKQRRGKNKNIELSKRPQGSKLSLIFRDKDGRPKGDARRIWSRHLGTMVRDPAIISHRQYQWKQLSTEQLDLLWRAISVRN